MLVQYCSDLHLEFGDNRLFMKKHPLPVRGEVLILAGDIAPFCEMERFSDFFDYVSDHFRQTYWVPGNHEYYGCDASERTGGFREKIRSNVELLNDTVIELEGVRMAFTTLWSHISPLAQPEIERCLNDFHRIGWGGRKLKVEDVNAFYAGSIRFLHEVLAENFSGKTMVISHHVPTFLNYPKRFAESELNEAFGSELSGLIGDSVIDYWIYGHHHMNVPEFKIGNSLLMTNQLGYVRHGEQHGFDPGRTIQF